MSAHTARGREYVVVSMPGSVDGGDAWGIDLRILDDGNFSVSRSQSTASDRLIVGDIIMHIDGKAVDVNFKTLPQLISHIQRLKSVKKQAGIKVGVWRKGNNTGEYSDRKAGPPPMKRLRADEDSFGESDQGSQLSSLGAPTQNGIAILRHELETVGKYSETVKLHVANLYRYTLDKYAAERLGISSDVLNMSRSEYVYDLVLSDSTRLMKVVLSPQFNILVNSGKLRQGSVVMIHSIELNKYNQRTYAVVKELTHVSAEIPSDTTWPEFGNASNLHERNTVPLMGGRDFYMPLYNDDMYWYDSSYEGTENSLLVLPPHLRKLPETKRDAWRGGEIQLADDTIQVTTKSTVLSEIMRHKDVKQPLIGRVVQRSRVIDFGKKSTKYCQPLPLMFHFGLYDSSLDFGSCLRVVVFGDLVPALYNRLQVGMIVRIINYRINTRPNGTVEVKLNSSKPKASVRLLSEANFVHVCEKQRRLVKMVERFEAPDSSLRLADTTNVHSLRFDEEFDFCGVITFVGPLHRLGCRSDNSGSKAATSSRKGSYDSWASAVLARGNIYDDEGNPLDFSADARFGEFRWIKVCDHLSRRELCIQIFSSSQIFLHSDTSARPGVFVFLRRLRLRAPLGGLKVASRRSVWACTSDVTEITTLNTSDMLKVSQLANSESGNSNSVITSDSFSAGKYIRRMARETLSSPYVQDLVAFALRVAKTGEGSPKMVNTYVANDGQTTKVCVGGELGSRIPFLLVPATETAISYIPEVRLKDLKFLSNSLHYRERMRVRFLAFVTGIHPKSTSVANGDEQAFYITVSDGKSTLDLSCDYEVMQLVTQRGYGRGTMETLRGNDLLSDVLSLMSVDTILTDDILEAAENAENTNDIHRVVVEYLKGKRQIVCVVIRRGIINLEVLL